MSNKVFIVTFSGIFSELCRLLASANTRSKSIHVQKTYTHLYTDIFNMQTSTLIITLYKTHATIPDVVNKLSKSAKMDGLIHFVSYDIACFEGSTGK